MRPYTALILTFLLSFTGIPDADAQDLDQVTNAALPSVLPQESSDAQTIFDDKMMIDGYTKKYNSLSKEILIEMIKDDTLSNYKMTAAVRVFSNAYSAEVVSKEKRVVEKILLRRLNKTDSPFVQVEVMCTLCTMDRYRYFQSTVPALIQKMNHYNTQVNAMAYACLDQLTVNGKFRAREARIVFNTLRKILFLSRKRLEKITEPDDSLSKKLILLRRSIKTLGSQQLQRLPKEIMHLL